MNKFSNKKLESSRKRKKNMGSKNSYYNSYFAKQIRLCIISLIFFLSLVFFLLMDLSGSPQKPTTNNIFSPTTMLVDHHNEGNIVISDEDIIVSDKRPEWFKIIAEELNTSSSIKKREKIKIGLVNLEGDHPRGLHGLVNDDHAEMVSVRFDRLAGPDQPKWEDFYPEWIDENHKWGPPKCPDIPLPSVSAYDDLDVVVASVPCGTRDVFGLQVNLVVANLAVRNGWVGGDVDRTVYVVFVGSCGPMLEIFRCDDVVKQRKGSFWLYKPEMRRLKQKVAMPFGSCQIAAPYAQTGKHFVPNCHLKYSSYYIINCFSHIINKHKLYKMEVIWEVFIYLFIYILKFGGLLVRIMLEIGIS